MSELPSYTQPTRDVEATQESSLSTKAPQKSISINIDNDLPHESASDGETGNASTSTENADNNSTSKDEIANVSISDEKAGKKPKSKDKKADNKSTSNDAIADASISDEKADIQSKSKDKNANTSSSDENAGKKPTSKDKNTEKKPKSTDKIAKKPTSKKKPKSRDSDNANTSTSDQRIQIQTFEQLYNILKEGGKDYLHFKVKRKKLKPCCSYYHHFVLLEVIEPKKETNETKIKEEQKDIRNENKPKDDKQNPNQDIYPNKEEQNGVSNENKTKNDVKKINKEFDSKGKESKPKVKEQQEETNENMTENDKKKINGKIVPDKEEQKEEKNKNKTEDDKHRPIEEIVSNKEKQKGIINENKPKDDTQNPNEEMYPNKEEQNGESNENENKNDVQKKVKEFNSKEEKSKPKVKEQKEETNENKTNYDEIKVMVAHYTSSKEIFTNNSKFGIGKFISETVIVKENERNKLFDYKSSKLYLINQPISTVDHTIRERLYSRLGERIYDFGANNCEHAVNYILTGKAESNIAKSRPRCADLVSAAFGELKEVGLKVAMIIALVSSLAGSLTRYSYVRLLIAGVAAQNANIGVNETCSNLLGDNIIDEAKVVLDKHSEIPRFSEIISSENIITDIKASLKNPFLCEIAELLAMEAIQKTFWLSICMSVSVETMFLIKRIFFVYKPLFEIYKRNKSRKGLFRMIFVRIVAGYLSIPIGILGGSVGQAFMSPPALYFFIFAFFATIITRYLLTIVASFMFDCFYCCFCECCCRNCSTRFYGSCKNMCCHCCCTYCCSNTDIYENKDLENDCCLSCCCVSETDVDDDQSDDGCIPPDDTPYCNDCDVKQCVCYSAAALCYSLCIAGIIVALYYFLD